MFPKATVVLVALFASATSVLAVCGGNKFAVGNVIALGSGVNRWDVYDNNCNIVDSLTTNLNPCTQGTFGCSPPPIYFNQYTNTFNKQTYQCHRDPVGESCGADTISVCCA
ncbi:hypothetical protein H0H93_001431 [Arthromyces matolae]|nr:hypothetical protein H0H93_001431 [Arthromyces matolae]